MNDRLSVRDPEPLPPFVALPPDEGWVPDYDEVYEVREEGPCLA